MMAIRKAHAEGKNWRLELNKFLLAYRSTPQSTTGISPAELLFRRPLRTKLPQVTDDTPLLDFSVRDRVNERQKKQRDQADKQEPVRPELPLQVGDQVLLQQQRQNKLSTTFAPQPYRVKATSGSQVQIQSSEGQVVARNASMLKEYVSDSESMENAATSNSPLEAAVSESTDAESSNVRVHSQAELRRSSRATRKPVWKKDYVCFTHD